jgi:hypothetical protein
MRAEACRGRQECAWPEVNTTPQPAGAGSSVRQARCSSGSSDGVDGRHGELEGRGA